MEAITDPEKNEEALATYTKAQLKSMKTNEPLQKKLISIAKEGIRLNLY